MAVNKTSKVLIIILSSLLAVSLIALCSVLAYKHFAPKDTSVGVASDNIISAQSTDDGEAEMTDNVSDDPSSADSGSTGVQSAVMPLSETANITSSNTPEVQDDFSPTANNSENNADAKEESATTLSLYSGNHEESIPFNVTNMFPGDSETNYFTVKVSHKGTVTLKYHADIRPGYEKLAEVLMVRISIPDKETVLYDGLMRDMPEALSHTLAASEDKTSEVSYEITAYLDTSVGNEYQEKKLVADFRWWVEETEELINPPKTGVIYNPLFYVCVLSGALLMIVILVAYRRRKTENE